MDKLDWSLIPSLLAVAKHGSLSAAARESGVSQPTLGRHVAEAEARLGLVLFARTPRGLVPTDACLALLPAARAMAEAAYALGLAAAGREVRLKGAVRLTASRIVSAHILPPILARLRATEPEIEIDLVPSDRVENLLHREADLALRMARPVQPDLIARHLADLPMALYATPGLLAQHGTPKTRDDFLRLPFVGFDRDDTILRLMAGLGAPRRREDFAVRCDDQLVYWQLVRAGLGVGGMQKVVGDADPAVTRLPPIVQLPALPVWLCAPPTLRGTPRVARVWDFLVAALAVPVGPKLNKS
ncbi:LysR family transcriptional regulator [Rhodobacter sp. Har01]|uniref:LysR family transcriptional regulator n=1 Tax=Rhodobacter sp. Har01 TaxID=2883999 RepID=UPI001D07EC22|nr:LysR family transcriptional regulator [Rhodobacter sp. Har01]MCB6179358.1 LysR family transcriptional regulator [Rhodobacter sp. Har01]